MYCSDSLNEVPDDSIKAFSLLLTITIPVVTMILKFACIVTPCHVPLSDVNVVRYFRICQQTVVEKSFVSLIFSPVITLSSEK